MSLIVIISLIFVFSAVSPIVIGYNVGSRRVRVAEPSAITSDGLMDSAWPMYCHDTKHTGRSPYSPTGKYGFEKWRFWIEDMVFQASPTIDKNGTIYIGGGDYEFFAIYPNGSLKWRFEPNSWIETTPALAADGTIYFGCNDNKLYALHSNGTLKWKLKVGDGWVHGSPVIDDNGIIYTSSVNGQNICAIYPNGTKKWSYHTDDLVYCSPAVTDDSIVYCGSNDGYLYALFSNNGSLKWRYKTGGRIGSAQAIGDNGIIYVGSTNGYLYAIYPNGTLQWKYRTFYIGGSSPAIAEDGTIYVGNGGDPPHKIYSINPDGTLNWTYVVEDEIHSSPAVDKDGIVYIGSFDGRLYAINPNGTLRWKFDTKGVVHCSPAIAEDGTIYFVAYTPLANSHLYAIEVREEAAVLKIGEIIPKFAQIEVELENVGELNAEQVEWSITIDYKLNIFRDRTIEGTIDNLSSGESTFLQVWPIFGLGRITIKITVSAPDAIPDWKEQSAFVIGPFIFLRD